MLSDAAKKDLHLLPKIRDQLTYLYLEHGWVDQDGLSIAFHSPAGVVPVPVATLAVLMLGPGTNVTHAAIRAIAENNCLVIWCGEENVRFYASGMGGTRSSTPLLRQALLASDPERRLEVVKRMYQARFPETLPLEITIEQLRGREGIRVRAAYARLSKEYGVSWSGRSFDRAAWGKADPINRAISAANSCLYGVCHAAILSVGLSPAIGFIHTGKQLSFVYDVADLYKVEVSLPIAFQVTAEDQAAAEGQKDIEREVRLRSRDRFRESRLLTRIVPDMWQLLGNDEELLEESAPFDDDPALPTEWWGPEGSEQAGPLGRR